MPERPRRPRDANQLAKLVVELSTGAASENLTFEGKNPAAVLLGRMGGQKGGNARAAALSPRKRSKIAKAAANARWSRARDST
jgi:hypothetical protein